MGVAALVLGIISIIVGFVPFCGAIAIVIITFWLFVFGAAASKTSKYVSDHDGEIRSYFNDFASSIQSNY